MASHKKTKNASIACRFGEWLRDIRESKQLPLRVVAAAAEMDQAHLSKVERGQRALTNAQAIAIAKFFGLDIIEVDARRIAEKFCLDYGDNPAAEQAINMLRANSSIGEANNRHTSNISSVNNLPNKRGSK